LVETVPVDRCGIGGLVADMDNKLIAFVALDQRPRKGAIDEYHRAIHSVRIENVVRYFPSILPGRRWSVKIPS
jgi:hypothetical protein